MLKVAADKSGSSPTRACSNRCLRGSLCTGGKSGLSVEVDDMPRSRCHSTMARIVSISPPYSTSGDLVTLSGKGSEICLALTSPDKHHQEAIVTSSPAIRRGDPVHRHLGDVGRRRRCHKHPRAVPIRRISAKHISLPLPERVTRSRRTSMAVKLTRFVPWWNRAT